MSTQKYRKVKICVELPEPWLIEIDKRAKEAGITRSAVIKMLLKEILGAVR